MLTPLKSTRRDDMAAIQSVRDKGKHILSSIETILMHLFGSKAVLLQYFLPFFSGYEINKLLCDFFILR